MPSLKEEVIKYIDASGPISVSKFMEFALSHPVYGYYQKKDPFGKEGDFVTAPEISQMFGEMLGVWCVSVWLQMNSPQQINIIEIGPGRGTLMHDLLRSTAHVPGFSKALSVIMIETSPILTKMQTNKLKDSHPNISWQTKFDDIPTSPSIIIANELFDALPIDQFVKKDGKWCERKITHKNNELVVILEKSDFKFASEYQEGTIKEISHSSFSLINKIANQIRFYNGAALIIDYGYEEPAYGDTLQAVRNHKYQEVLANIGDSDITSHVNFTALKHSVMGVNISGPIGQGSFLNNLGINLRAQILKQKNPEQIKEVDLALARLTTKDQMGELFRCLCLSNTSLPKPVGF